MLLTLPMTRTVGDTGPGHPTRTQSARNAHRPRRPGALLAELGRLNSDVVPLAMKIMDESVTVIAEEQHAFAERLVAMGRRLERGASGRPAG